MNNELMLQLQAAKGVFEQKEKLETLIYEEKLKIREHILHLQMLESKMDLKAINYRDKGRRLGARFAFIAFFPMAIVVVLLLCGLFGEAGFTGGIGACAVTAFGFGLPGAIVSTLLLRAYYKGKKPRVAAVELVRVERDEYLENTAKPESEKHRKIIAELEAQIAANLQANDAVIAFLPEDYRNVEAVSHMEDSVRRCCADDLQQAMQLCDKKKIGRKYRNKIRDREMELAKKYVNPELSGDSDDTLFGMILDAFLGLIFR